MSKHKTNAARRVGTTVIAALVLGLLAEGAFASSMRCGGAIISAGGRPPPTQAEVRWRCGEPYSRTGNNWIYVQPNGTVYRVRFNDNGELRSVQTERLSR